VLFAKFIPGFSLITVAMAGVTKMSVLDLAIALEKISKFEPATRQ